MHIKNSNSSFPFNKFVSFNYMTDFEKSQDCPCPYVLLILLFHWKTVRFSPSFSFDESQTKERYFFFVPSRIFKILALSVRAYPIVDEWRLYVICRREQYSNILC